MKIASAESAIDPFYENAVAANRFALALEEYIKRPPFSYAASLFETGLVSLGLDIKTLENISYGRSDPEALPALALTLQASDGLRNLGFTHFRQHLHGQPTVDKAPAERAPREIAAAIYIPSLILSLTARGELALSEAEQAKVIARQGVAQALVMRARSAELLLGVKRPAFGLDPFSWIDDTDDDASFHSVDTYLAQGDNGYWRVSNAMVAARHRRALGDSLHSPEMREWRALIRDTLSWTKAKDPANLAASRKTVLRHGISLASPATARRAATSARHI